MSKALANRRWQATWKKRSRRPETEALRPVYVAMAETKFGEAVHSGEGLNEADRATYTRHLSEAYARISELTVPKNGQRDREARSREWWAELKNDPERYRAFVEDRRLKQLAGIKRKRGG